jgi:trimeric autotransporter adhesin
MGCGWSRLVAAKCPRSRENSEHPGDLARTWTNLKASNTGVDDYFGDSVALSGDTLAVGASGEGSAAQGVGGDQANNTASDSGAVYVFQRSGTTWLQEAYLKASNTGAGDLFGTSVALSGDTLAVGAFREDSGARGVGGDQDDNSASDSGAVYVFRRSGTVWQQEAYIKASNTGADDYFGYSVALSGDTLAVGAPYEDSAAQGVGGDQTDNTASDSGAVYIFH